MDLDQLRQQMSTSGRVDIRRHRGRCGLWVLGYLAIAAIGLVLLRDGSAFAVGVGLLLVLSGAVGAAQLAPGLLGRAAVRVDAEGVRIGRRLAPWSQIAAIEPRVVQTRGVTQHLVVLTDAERRTPFHAPGARAPWWPWGGKVVPRGLTVRQLDLLTFLREELLVSRSGTRPTIAPPLLD